jgi:hypothetical protein
MKTKIFFILLCIPLLFLVACTSDSDSQQDKKPEKVSNSSKKTESNEQNVTTGYIVSKDEDSLWVIPNIKKEELMVKSKESLDVFLKEKYEAGEGIDFKLDNIDEQTVSSLHIGQKVVVTYNSLGLSAPASANAIKIRVLKE